jgi:CheY-like chemotaxis protein
MKILYADDDTEEIEFFCAAVMAINPAIDCITATRGEDALNLLKCASVPDVIFLDFQMPFMNGMECLLKIKRDNRINHIPVIIYSTAVNLRLGEYLKEAGAFRVVNKCADIVKLTNELRTCLQAAKQETSGRPLQSANGHI